MRKIVAGLFMSLDGVVESPHEWHFPWFDEDMGRAVDAQIKAADAMLLGRKSYVDWAGYWTNVPSDGDDGEIAAFFNNVPKFVVSTTLDAVEWSNSTLIKGDLAEELTRLKQQPGKNISISGSVTLIQSLVRDGLLDELALLVHPIVVGKGKRLFEHMGESVSLRLVGSQTFGSGVLYLTYAPAEKA